ncbi:MAG: DNA-processing protein DprA, partial [Thermoleophilia bacterium]|nr:DNA-processing protein DprA [Thermoleophilia bacterium]
VYPMRHRGLYEQLLRSGLLASEYPPGTPPARWTFPLRNRLLAALGDAVLVVEGARNSGALQTADWALLLGRPVLAVPGPIGPVTHEGCHWLLHEGAVPAIDPALAVEDFFSLTRIERGERTVRLSACKDLESRKAQDASVDSLGVSLRDCGLEIGVDVGSPEAAVWGALAEGGRFIDELAQQAGLSARETCAALGRLEVLGLVLRSPAGRYIRAP